MFGGKRYHIEENMSGIVPIFIHFEAEENILLQAENLQKMMMLERELQEVDWRGEDAAEGTLVLGRHAEWCSMREDSAILFGDCGKPLGSLR